VIYCIALKPEPRAADSWWLDIIRGGGLVAPAIRDADKMSLDELMTQLREILSSARAAARCAAPICRIRRSRSPNLGERSVETVFGVIYPPQVALVGFGMPVERP
jgi:pyruvate dehydrogenase E2 component (dihydrolipoamide acetyltransferase)